MAEDMQQVADNIVRIVHKIDGTAKYLQTANHSTEQVVQSAGTIRNDVQALLVEIKKIQQLDQQLITMLIQHYRIK